MSPLVALATAVAALLVCARAGALDVMDLVFPDLEYDRIYKNDREPPLQYPKDLHTVYNSLKTGESLFPNERQDRPYYTENDSDGETDAVLSNYRKNKAKYELQKSGRRIILKVDHDKPKEDPEKGGESALTENIDQIYNDFLKKKPLMRNDHHHRAHASGMNTQLPSACLYDGRWHSDGAAVSTREDCLNCVCAAGVLSCRRRACAPLPDPLPPHCHVRHRRDVCCPELHCPDGVQVMEHEASARSDIEDMSAEADVQLATPVTAKNACVEGGSVFAAGSAMAARVACEQCFCLRGARHCVRPACLPPPAHCSPRPAPGACCPARYYCHAATDPSQPHHHRSKHDCQVDGTWAAEGSPVGSRGNCSACFCLRGEVHCQALGCAPALAGCRPLLAPGACCAHQYVCDHGKPARPLTVSKATDLVLDEDDERVGHTNDVQTKDIVKQEAPAGAPSHVIADPPSSPTSSRHDERTLHTSKSSKLESTTKSSKPESTTNKILTSLYTLKQTSFAPATKNHLISTTKVKRKTDEPPVSSSTKPEQNTITTSNNTNNNNITTTHKPMSAAKLIATPQFSPLFDSEHSPDNTMEQPEGTVKIVINGTINCTAELSSTSLPLNIMNETNKHLEVLPRVPIVNVEAQTYSPNDIITDRNVNGGFDDDDTFTINVTSSLMTNTSHSTSRPAAAAPKVPVPVELVEALNSSKKKKGEYDYDYTEPTLPPSLPNLKIIPFVAADAVLDDEPTKETLTYPILEREDKFPVYYPTTDTKDTKFPVRRVDQPTQYPVFVLGKVEPAYPPIRHEVDVPRDRYPERNEPGVREYTVSASLGGQDSEEKTVTQVPSTSTDYAVESPAVNLFSPPVETEGGFLPKGTGVIDNYFGVYPSTPSGPAAPHLTTSMQIDVIDMDGECVVERQRVAGGQSIVLGCQLCTCAWGQLACAPRPCAPAPPPCRRLPATNHSADVCCGDVDCTPEINASSAKPSAIFANASADTLATEIKENRENVMNVEVPHTTSEPITVVSLANKTITDNTKANNTEKVTANDSTTPPQENTESVKKTTTAAIPTTTSAKPTPKLTTTTTTPAPVKQDEDTSSEDEEEEDDDGGFSFGSVLKLLLSNSYETTTAPSKKPPTRAPPRTPPSIPPTRKLSTSAPSTSRYEEENLSSFKPLPPRQPYINPMNTVNRIDHLVLGEATAIKRTTPRPIMNKTTKRPTPPVYERPTLQTYERPTPQTYDTTEKRTMMQEDSAPFTPVAAGGPRPPSLAPSVGAGLLKLAGCNIYGRMYRVGRIITELSTPCTECWCTELGVQCKPLNC